MRTSAGAPSASEKAAMALRASRKKSQRKRVTDLRLPDIVVPPARNAIPPLCFGVTPDQSDKYAEGLGIRTALSARVTASSMYHSCSSGTTPFDAAMESCYKGFGDPAASKGSASSTFFSHTIRSQTMSASQAPTESGSFSARMFPQVGTEDRRLPARTARSAAPRLMRDPSQRAQALLEASRSLASGADAQEWVGELEKILKTSQDQPVPSIGGTAWALDALWRLAKVLPVQGDIIAELVKRLDDSIYPRSHHDFQIVQDKRLSPCFSDDDWSSESSSNSDEQPGLGGRRFSYKLSKKSEVDAKTGMAKVRPADYFLVDDEDSKNHALTRESVKRNSMLEMKKVDSLPHRYESLMPYFLICTTQRNELTKAKQRLAWMHRICEDVEGQQHAQSWLLDFVHEMTQGSLLAWTWAFWKASASEAIAYQKQSTRSFSIQRELLKRIWVTWRVAHVSQALRTASTDDQQLHNEVKRLQLEIAHVKQKREDLVNDLDLGKCDLQHLNFFTDLATTSISSLHRNMQQLRPETLKGSIDAVVKSIFRFFSRTAGTEALSWKAAIMDKDLTNLISQDDEETADGVGKCECKEFLRRWMNHLLVELKYCAADFLEQARMQDASGSGKVRVGEWSSQDIASYLERCRAIRAVHQVEDMEEDLNCTVLIGVFAMIQAYRIGRTEFDPADLWPLEIRDKEERAAAVCTCLRSLAPTHAARHLLRGEDILNCNTTLLTKFLSVIFLAETPGLDQAARSEAAPLTENQAAPGCIAAFHTLERSAGSIAYNQLDDPSRLLMKGEMLHDLFQIPVRELLLRWVKQSSGIEVKNLGADLKDGVVLLALLRNIAPDVLQIADVLQVVVMAASTPIAPEEAVDIVVQAGQHCMEHCTITKDAILHGHEEILSGFVGSLFLHRTCLGPVMNSPLQKHSSIAEKVFKNLHKLSRSNGDAKHYQGLAREIKTEHDHFGVAFPGLLKARETMNNIKLRVEQFVNEHHHGALKGFTLALDPSLHSRLSTFIDHAKHAGMIDKHMSEADPVEVFSKQTRQIIYEYAPFFHDIYNVYCVTIKNGEPRLPLEGIMRLHKACKFQCPCASLPAWVAEGIYYEVLEQDLPAWREFDETGAGGVLDSGSVLEGLSMRGLVRWILRVAMYRLAKAEEINDDECKFHMILKNLIERHLKPYAYRFPEDEFGRLAGSMAVRCVFMAHEFVLWAIFEFYASTMKESHDDNMIYSHGQVDINVMEIDAFVVLLEDCRLLHGKITKEVARSTCKSVLALGKEGSKFEDRACFRHQAEKLARANPAGIHVRASCITLGAAPKPRQANCKTRWSVRQSRCALAGTELADDQLDSQNQTVTEKESLGKKDNLTVHGSLSFFDFLHCLLGIALYSRPNLLTSAELRVEQFLKEAFLPGVISHCMRFPDPSVHPELRHAWLRHSALLKVLTVADKADEDRAARCSAKKAYFHRKMRRHTGFHHRSGKGQSRRPDSATGGHESVLRRGSGANQSRRWQRTQSSRRTRSSSPVQTSSSDSESD